MSQLPEYVDGLLNVSGSERLIEEALRDSRRQPVFINRSGIDFGRINSAFAIALHMHQPVGIDGPTGGKLRRDLTGGMRRCRYFPCRPCSTEAATRPHKAHHDAREFPF
jgi:hypothetical protein